MDLVFNVGAPRDTHHGGGTYGFGKVITYLTSQCRTVIIHSVSTDERDNPVERIIACAMTPTYLADGVRYIGRHWWGVVSDDIVAPLPGSKHVKPLVLWGYLNFQRTGPEPQLRYLTRF